MTITIEITAAAADGWNIVLDTPGVHYECQGVSGRRAVQVVTAEVEAAIDRETQAPQPKQRACNNAICQLIGWHTDACEALYLKVSRG